MENFLVIKRATVEPMLQRAIALAKYYKLGVRAGIHNNADGDCALEVVIDQLLSRKCFQSIFEKN